MSDAAHDRKLPFRFQLMRPHNERSRQRVLKYMVPAPKLRLTVPDKPLRGKNVLPLPRLGEIWIKSLPSLVPADC